MESNIFLLSPPQLHHHQLIKRPLYLLYSHHHHRLLLLLRFSSTTIISPNQLRRQWDSNAVRASRFKFNLNNDHFDYEDEEEEEERESARGRRRKRRWWTDGSWQDMNQKSSGALDDVIDSFWIFKVFKSYGWLLPIILVSWLLATGPKSFLMALALLLGQSALLLAFEKLWGKSQGGHKRNTKRRNKPSPRTVSSVEMEEQEQEDSRETRKGNVGYQSWMDDDDGSNVKGVQDVPSFGGWEELDRTKSVRRPSRTTKGSRSRHKENSKLSGRGRNDMPLLLRLLIAVFPFLGSWTRML